MSKIDSSLFMSPVKQIVIGNIRKDTTIEDLKDCFSQLIKKHDVSFRIAVDKKGKQKGFAAVSIPITLVNDFLNYNGRNMKGHRITVVLSEDFKISKSTRWQQEETGVFKTPSPNQYNSLRSMPFLYKLFDAGVYLTHPKFSKNALNVIERAQSCGVKKMVVLGANVHQCEQALGLCRLFSGSLFCTAGLGPKHAPFWTDEAETQLTQIASSGHCVAIGECGLDLSTDELSSSQSQQLYAFEKQIQLSIKLKKPLVVIEKQAHIETLSLLQKYKDQLVDVVVSFVPENKAQIVKYVQEGFYIYIHGNVFLPQNSCIKKWLTDSDEETNVPFDRLLLGSAAPYHSVFRCTDIDWYPRQFTDDTQHKSFDIMLKHCKDNYSEPCSLPSMLVMMCCMVGDRFTPRSLAEKLTQNAVTFFHLDKSVGEEASVKVTGEKFCNKTPASHHRRWSFFVVTALVVVAAVVLLGVVCVKYSVLDKVGALYNLL
ncbi:3'-5' ssDNA/RNA exonuclease TatD-like [Gigantopelta aegis]|uniref:3'-5' ssDNA/RNA exonuclease TatD-like n=1 Tax=Gigantopelta aegis TaxID=1735272 RepID=UPI001B888F8A|nr:3'-5' ssDNA/RNA exonuclease TatD-like [Gigantopelta aegis]